MINDSAAPCTMDISMAPELSVNDLISAYTDTHFIGVLQLGNFDAAQLRVSALVCGG